MADIDVEAILAELTLAEKVALTAGWSRGYISYDDRGR
jgi:hypothetical protein